MHSTTISCCIFLVYILTHVFLLNMLSEINRWKNNSVEPKTMENIWKLSKCKFYSNLNFLCILSMWPHSSGFIQKASEFCRSFVFWLFSHFSTSGDPTQGANSPIFCGFEYIPHTKIFLVRYILKISILI